MSPLINSLSCNFVLNFRKILRTVTEKSADQLSTINRSDFIGPSTTPVEGPKSEKSYDGK